MKVFRDVNSHGNEEQSGHDEAEIRICDADTDTDTGTDAYKQAERGNVNVAVVWEHRTSFEGSGSASESACRVAMNLPDVIQRERLAACSPMELMMMALAGCIGINLRMILERMRQPVEALRLEAIGWQESEAPFALKEAAMTIYVQGTMEEKKLQRALQLAKERYCAVSASLRCPIRHVLYLNDRKAFYDEDL